MLETAIVGAGLCGLVLARGLRAQGRSFGLFEARDRLGGRILSVPSDVAGMALDLGPTWFWPETQPRITRLVNELGLRSFPQHDTGEVLSLTDHDKQPDAIDRANLHGGAHRLEGGMAGITDAVGKELPAEVIHLGHVLAEVVDRGDHVLLRFRRGDETVEVAARQAVLAMPPRLIDEHVRIQPPLDDEIREAMRETHTWMAGQAKALVAYPTAFWREQGHSGNAFVHHEHVVLGEIFDACDAEGSKAALGGFFSLTAESRDSLRNGMAMLVSSQLVQVFGGDAETGEQHLQDWAMEPCTCSTRDRTTPESHPEYGHPGLRRPQWNNKLHFGGSETASFGGGYLEGALEAAARLQRSLTLGVTVDRSDRPAEALPAEAGIARFSEWVSAERREAFGRYRRLLNQNLAGQMKEQITQRAVLGAMEQVYSEALTMLDELHFETMAEAARQGRSGLSAKVLAPFLGFNRALLDEVVLFNRSSCAISNFPDEHDISPEYLHAIARDMAAAWREFAIGVDGLLTAKLGAVHPEVATAA